MATMPELKIPLIILVTGIFFLFSGIISQLTYDDSPTIIYPELNYNDITPAAYQPVTELEPLETIETGEYNGGESFTVSEEAVSEQTNQEQPLQEETTEIPTCTSCEYLENNTCLPYACCFDIDCADGDSATQDVCNNPKTEAAKCSHTTIPTCNRDADCNDNKDYTTDTCDTNTLLCKFTATANCQDDDGTCPNGCTFKDDTDCNVTDEIFLGCSNSITCYRDTVVMQGNATLCKNINFYWEDTDNKFESSCYFDIAAQNMDCALCQEIINVDIKQQCITAVC
jgi:hypothetical protein